VINPKHGRHPDLDVQVGRLALYRDLEQLHEFH
jgi:hypothetical protein